MDGHYLYRREWIAPGFTKLERLVECIRWVIMEYRSCLRCSY